MCGVPAEVLSSSSDHGSKLQGNVLRDRSRSVANSSICTTQWVIDDGAGSFQKDKMKRKQKDFQKTKLKVGRKLPKGNNVTDTSFQTRQIKITQVDLTSAMGDKPLSMEETAAERKEQGERLKAQLRTFASSAYFHKIDTLQKIHNFIAIDLDSLILHFPDILSKIGNALLETDQAVVELSVKIFAVSLLHLTHAQFKAFSKTLVMHLSCMMSHGMMAVKKESLNLLEAALFTHPKIITRHPKVLFSLLNMISVKRAGKARKLVDHIHSNVSSLQWRQDVLNGILDFLKGMMDPEEDDDDDDNEDKGPREVHWDGETNLFLPLYAARGPVQVDFEWYASRKVPDSVELKNFVFELTYILGGLLKGELPYNMRVQQAVILSATDTKYLNLIVQLLCYTGEWSRQNLQYEEENVEIYYKQMQDIITLQLLRGFPYSQSGHTCDSNGRRLKEPDSVQLNLGICYLYNMFLLESGDRIKSEKQSVLDHLADRFCIGSQMSDETILVILKMCKILIQSKHVNKSYKNLTMAGLYGILETYKLSVHNKMLQSFFMELSLDYDYRELMETEFMADWLTYLFKELGFMMESGEIDVDFLKYIRQLCARKYPKFIDTLNSLKQEDILKLLQYNNEEFQLTVVHMIAAMDHITASLFHDMSDLISQNDVIPLQISTKLIYFLHYRFSSPDVSSEKKLQFVKFLLNVACDTRSFKVPSQEYDESISKLLFDNLGQTKYKIYATTKWETHRKIFEVCSHCLSKYCEDDLLKKGVLMFFESFYELLESQIIPIHMILAFLAIQQKVYHLFKDSNLKNLFNILIFSCFMYISVITNDAHGQAADCWVLELQKLLLVPMYDKNEVNYLFEVNKKFIDKFSDIEYVHVFRIVTFIKGRGKLDQENPCMHNILDHLGRLSRQSAKFERLWFNLWNTQSSDSSNQIQLKN